jgi:hypothetical protein
MAIAPTPLASRELTRGGVRACRCADFLREQLGRELEGEEDIYGAVDEAKSTCHSSHATHLPGYIPLDTAT